MTQVPFASRADVGIVGGGQLARMTAHAALSLGLDVAVLAGNERAPVSPWRDVCARIPEPATLEAFSRRCDLLTFEHELADPEVVGALELLGRAVRPGAVTLRAATDKAMQRQLLVAAGLPVPPFALVADLDDVRAFARSHGWNLVLKATRGGLDGRGVHVVDGDEQALFALAIHPGRLLVEPALRLEAELAVLLARRPCGEAVVYPVVRTTRRDGMCRTVHAPSGLGEDVERRARDLAREVAEAVDATGILAVGLFLVDGELLVNEIAARPHDSGHLTIEGCATSQFENHLRAILDWPLGPTDLRAPAVAMADVVAVDATACPRDRLPHALALGPVHVHLYGKATGPGRTVGHVTVLGETPAGAAALAAEAAELLGAAASVPLPA